ncbi:hypothetical protein S225a_07660 [Candidatus Brocadiaceae bacterium S225]|nr:hypothetical protein S225a_07660 [Candidatus Brocadiaceae bacterium S225]
MIKMLISNIMEIKRKFRSDSNLKFIEYIHMFLFYDRNKSFFVANRLCHICHPESCAELD